MTWRPYLDLQIIQHRRFAERGIPRYAAELSRALLNAGVRVAALALNPRLPYPTRVPPELARSPRLTWNTSRALRAAVEEGPTLYHLLAPFEPSDLATPWLPLQVARNEMPLVISVYDLIPEVMGFVAAGSRAERFFRIRNRLLAGADLLLALSEQTRSDVVERLGVPAERVHVVGAGCSDYFRPPGPGEAPDAVLREQLPAIDRPYVLTVSAWEPRKNTELLIDAFGMLSRDVRDGLQLVIACNLPLEGQAQWRDRAHRRGLRARDVVFTGFVPDLVLRALYQQTEIFVDPSRYEGFGLPVVEAARCGAPSVVAHAPGLQEVLAWEPARFDANDPQDLATLMERGVKDEPFRARLLEVAGDTAARHTWDRVARRTVAAYEHLDIPARRRRARPQRRVALVGPFPPVRTGIASYNADVAAHLAEHCELDCYVDSGDWVHEDVSHEAPRARVHMVGPRRPPDTRARWLPARALGRRIDPVRYDAIIYAIGNSWFHHDTLSLARRFPGVAWFHDVDLTGLYITYAHRLLAQPDGGGEARTLFRDVLDRYRTRRPDVTVSESDRAWASYEPYRRTGTRFTAELARDARACVVTSDRARQLLQLDAGPPELLPPVHTLPLAVPRLVRSRQSPASSPMVVSLGRQDLDAKEPEALLEAMAIVVRTRPARLAIVGEIRPEHHARLASRAEQLGIAKAVEITGHVDDAEYQRRLEDAWCAVQLRRSSADGGGSAAVNDALGVGLPVITNIASCRELPPGTVQLLSPTATPRALAAEILRVLEHDDLRQQLGERALEYARTWSFAGLTTRLLEIIDARTAPQWQPQPKTA
jgi:glycosyltransferase involved in cell wall biosynthesis